MTTKLITSTFLFFSCGLLSHAANFPLQTGNVWVYKQTSGNIPQGPRTIEVGRKATFDGREYYAVNFFGRSAWLRETDDDKVFAYDTTLKSETLWLDFTAKESFPTTIDACSKSALVMTKAPRYKGPFGEFDNVTTVTYQPSCADAGFMADVFLPHIGLLQHTEQTIAGPITFDLVYSHTGLTEVADSQVGFGLALDSTTYPASTKEAIVRMTLKNGTGQTLKLTFPTAQDFDVAVRDEKGQIVYRWSADRGFAQVFRTVELQPGESKTFVVVIPIDRLQPGRYTAEANLATSNPREYTASVTFDVTAK